MKLPLKALSMLGALLIALPSAHGSLEVPLPRTQAHGTTQWGVDLEQLRSAVDAGKPIEVPLGDQGFVSLSLTEFSVIALGQKKIVHVDENGEILHEEPFNYWSYRGSVVGFPSAKALITMDDLGLYGHLRLASTTITFKPAAAEPRAPGELAPIEVRWVIDDPLDLPLLPVPSGVAISDGPSVQVVETGDVQPHADLAFRSTHSNFATRISNAFAAQADMWLDQTDINLNQWAIVAAPNYSTSSSCTQHLRDFRDGHGTSGADADQLFTGKNVDCNGWAFFPSVSGTMAATRQSLVESVDHSNWDTYDPDETTTDLALVSGQEIAHNWGERDHPQDQECGFWSCTYNIMAAGTDHDARDFWFTAGDPTDTEERIRSATSGNL